MTKLESGEIKNLSFTLFCIFTVVRCKYKMDKSKVKAKSRKMLMSLFSKFRQKLNLIP